MQTFSRRLATIALLAASALAAFPVLAQYPNKPVRLLAQGSIAVGSTPEEADVRIRSEYALWNKVVKTGNIKPE